MTSLRSVAGLMGDGALIWSCMKKILLEYSRVLLIGVLLLGGLIGARAYNLLLFNTLAGLIAVVVSLSIFLFTWNSRGFIEPHYLLFLGIAYLFVGGFDLAQTFALFGEQVIQGYNADLPTQLWISSRYLQSISLVIAPRFFRRKLNPGYSLLAYAGVSILLLVEIFGGYFPESFIKGQGVSSFAIISEMFISVLLLAAILFLLLNREQLGRKVFLLVLWSILLTLASELIFGFVQGAISHIEVAAHFLRIAGISAFYLAVIHSGFLEPYDLVFQDLKRSQEVERTFRRLAEVRKAELEALRQNLADILADIELPRLLKSILERAVVLLNASGGELGLYDQEKHEIQIVVSHNLGIDSVGTRMAMAQGAMGVVAETREPVIIKDTARWEGISTDHADSRWDSVMVAPLKVGERLVGVISVVETEPDRKFDESDLSLLTLLAHQAAIGINNAQLFDRARKEAFTDSLTGLSTRRHFFEVAEREIGRSHRYGSPLSIIMSDLDQFKAVNDQHGHAAGDQVLAAAARLLRNQLREVDVVGRYGGDEFAILLPETRLATAKHVAERLRGSIEKTEFTANDQDQVEVRLTACMGVAQLMEDCPDIDTLLERADQALYAAKQAGPNQVYAWGE